MNPRRVFSLLTTVLCFLAVGAAADQPPLAPQLRDALPPGAVARLGSLRFQHGADAYCLVFSPDGKTILSGGTDHVIRAFDVETGKEIQRWTGHTDAVRCLAVSPDGKRVASHADDESVRIWDFANGKELFKGEAGSGAVQGLAFSPDGKRLASASTSIRLWDVKTGTLVREFGAGNQWYRGLAYLDDKTLITGKSEDGIIRYWNLPDGTERFKVVPAVEGKDSCGLALSGDRKLLATIVSGENGYLRLAKATTGEELRKVAAKGEPTPWLCAVSPDATLAAWMPRDNNEISVVDTATGKEVNRLVGATNWTAGLAFSPDGNTVAASSGGTLRLWDVKSGREHPQTRGRQGSVRGFAFRQDDQGLAVLAFGPDIVVWDVVTAKERGRLAAGNAGSLSNALYFLATGQDLVYLKYPGQMFLWNVSKSEPKPYPVCEELGSAYLLAPGGKIAAGGNLTNGIPLWNPETGKTVRRLDTNENLCAFSPSGETLLTCKSRVAVTLWDVATGTQRWQVNLAAGEVVPAAVAFSPDGSLIAWACWNEKPASAVQVVAAGDGRGMRRIPINDFGGAVGALAFSRDGRTLIGGGEFIRLWEVASGDARGQLGGDQGHLHSLTYSHDGRRLASGGGDGTVLLWDVTGAHLRDKNRTTEALWEDLAGKDAVKAYRAGWQLADSPKEAVELLRAKLKAVTAPDPKRIDQLIAALDANGFEERTQAKAELAGLAEFVEPALRAAAKTPASEEVGKQLADLLETFAERRLKPTPEQLRPIRAVEVLEEVGTPEAKDVLRTLAKGAPGAALTREARASLRRLERRPDTPQSK